jgi:hypothetical protein
VAVLFGGEIGQPKREVMKKIEKEADDELRPEYDLKELRVRKVGPERKSFGDIVRLEPDVVEAFPDADSVNEALRSLIRVSKDKAPNIRRTT